MKLVQVSDLHFVPPGVRLLGIDPRARFSACVADINANHADAELCLLTGDLADRGAPEAYAALREALADLRVPYRLMVGNHDDRAAFRGAFPEAPCASPVISFTRPRPLDSTSSISRRRGVPSLLRSSTTISVISTT